MFEVSYNYGRTSYVSNCNIRPKGLLDDVERDMLAIANFLLSQLHLFHVSNGCNVIYIVPTRFCGLDKQTYKQLSK